jgi:hypothetical protein
MTSFARRWLSAPQKTTPQQARSILTSTPQIAYALVALMVKMNAIDVQVLQVRMFISPAPGLRVSSHDVFHRSLGLDQTSHFPNGLARRKRSLRTLQTCQRQPRSHPLRYHQLPPYLHTSRNIARLLHRHIHPLTITDTLTRLNHQIKFPTWHKVRVNMLVLVGSGHRLLWRHR